VLPFSELRDWQKAAEFVADFVDYQLLDEPTELVSSLVSLSANYTLHD